MYYGGLFATITTVGYGDRFPATTEGRILGGLLMTMGGGLFGVFTAAIALWFMEQGSVTSKTSDTDIGVELQQFRNEIRARASKPDMPILFVTLGRIQERKTQRA